jgi:hypothetical protein
MKPISRPSNSNKTFHLTLLTWKEEKNYFMVANHFSNVNVDWFRDHRVISKKNYFDYLSFSPSNLNWYFSEIFDFAVLKSFCVQKLVKLLVSLLAKV